MLRDTFKTLTVRKRAGERASCGAALQDRQSREIPPRALGASRRGTADRRTEGRGGCGRAAVPADRPRARGAPKPDDRDAFARRVFSSAPGLKEVKITRAEPLRMGQAQGYEIIADAKDASRAPK